jgi:hypothetical protein
MLSRVRCVPAAAAAASRPGSLYVLLGPCNCRKKPVRLSCCRLGKGGKDLI